MKKYIFQIVILAVVGCGSSHVGSPTGGGIKVTFVNKSEASKSSELKSLSINKVQELVQNEMTGDAIFVYQVAAIPYFCRECHGEIVTVSDNTLYVYNFRNKPSNLKKEFETEK